MKQDYVSIMLWAFVKPLLIAGAVLVVLVFAMNNPKLIGWLGLAWLGWLVFSFIYLAIYDTEKAKSK